MKEIGPLARSVMFPTTIAGNGDEVEAVDDVDEEAEDSADEEEAELAPLCPPVSVETTVLVTVLVAVVCGGGAGGAVEGAKRLFATEAMPTVTKTTPRVMATLRK